MTTRSGKRLKADEIEYFGFSVYEVEMSHDDTFEAEEFVDSENLKIATLVKELDGTELTCSISNNVVTMTDTGTNVMCVLFIYGRLA